MRRTANPLFRRNIQSVLSSQAQILLGEHALVLKEIQKKSGSLSPDYFSFLFAKDYLANTHKFKALLDYLNEAAREDREVASYLQQALAASLAKVLNNLSHTNPETCTDLLLHVAPYWDPRQMANLLSSNLEFRDAANLVLKRMDEVRREQILNVLIPLCIKKCHPALLNDLQSAHPELFHQIFEGLDNEKKVMGRVLLDMKNERTRVFISGMMQQFVNGFGRINYEGGLLACAQIASRRGESFHPTVLRKDNFEEHESEFRGFLQILKDGPRPAREKFILTGTHWVAGEVKIDEQGRASLFIIDSLGALNNNSFATETVKHFAALFPDSPIYYSLEKRQNSGAGCSVFSIDDVAHLYTLEQYLDPKYDGTGLFGYLESHQTGDRVSYADLDDVKVRACYVPLSLNRTMQSSRFLEDADTRTIPGEETRPVRDMTERSLKVNKKGQTAYESVQKNFRSDRNMRASDKLEKAAVRTAKFLIEHQDHLDKVEEKMKDFTLDSFRKRILEQTADSRLASRDSEMKTAPDPSSSVDSRSIDNGPQHH
ncbi:hypothetical protein AQUSIP_08530 [Aquicella siphonis]|uniref:Uncharacterized protein n=1 Tax=Aquicella siphonis TaxID=254247 RepID=A0A5E4PGT1_9COXI|nr:hypothetical protein [Aquicella siphonis]VVC75563.1 hypothetical protein AQUSIP_08530 [Aquicella siphonis]